MALQGPAHPLQKGGVGAAEPTRSSILITMLLEGLRWLEVDVDRVLARAGLKRSTIEQLPARVPMSLSSKIWDAAVEVSGDPSIGVRVGLLTQIEHYDVAGYVIRYSATLGDALHRFSHYGRLIGEGMTLVVSVEGDRAVLRQPDVAGAPQRRQVDEVFVTGLGVVARQLTGIDVQALEIHFKHRQPEQPSLLTELTTARLYYGAPYNGIVLPIEALSLPVQGHDARLCKILERQADQCLRELPARDDFVRRVQTMLAEELNGGNPSADQVASRLEISTRTLSRRLKALGTSHQRLLDHLRYALAVRYLRETDMDLAEVAFVLGFSDASALNRAFKRWCGTTPSGYRRRG